MASKTVLSKPRIEQLRTGRAARSFTAVSSARFGTTLWIAKPKEPGLSPAIITQTPRLLINRKTKPHNRDKP